MNNMSRWARKPITLSWKLNDAQLNHHWVMEVTMKQTKDFLQFNENEERTYPNLWDTTKAVSRGKFIAFSTHIKNLEKFHIVVPLLEEATCWFLAA